MQTVSTEYKTQINNKIRNPSYIEVFLSVIDPDAIGADTLTSSVPELYYSELAKTDLDILLSKKYGTLEHNRFFLDGSAIFPPEIIEPIDYYQGYVGNAISDNNGNFEVNPKITINFSDYFAFLGLTFKFDTVLKSCVSELQIIGYNDVTEVYNETIYPNNSFYVMEDRVPSTGTINKIELYCLRTNPIRRRVLIESILFGVVKEFTNSVITKAIWNKEVDLLSSKLPINSFEFTSLDIAQVYNPDNPIGIWPYLEKKQPATFKYGYELDTGGIEWIQGGKLYTDGNVKVSSNGSLSSVTFSFTSYLNQLTDTYYKGKYYSSGISLYDLAVDVFAVSNFTDYYVDPALNSVMTKLPLPEVPCNQALQLIANAGKAVIYTDRDGKIYIVRLIEVLQDFKFDFSNMKSIPIISKIPELYSVDTFYTTMIADVTDSELVRVDVAYGTPTRVRVTHSEATGHSISYGALTVTGIEYYATSTIFIVTGTGTVIVNGKKLNRNKTNVLLTISDRGYNCPIENVLIDNYTYAVEYATWVASILVRRNAYESDDRGYPELDLLDNILVDTLFSTDVEATLYASKIEFNGTLTAYSKYISVG